MISPILNNTQKDTKKVRGFTLVETLVAITILLVTIVGPFYAISKSILATYVARDKLIATALAQEGVEYIRGIRDSNYLVNYRAGTQVYNWVAGVDGTSNGRHNSNCFNNACLVDVPQDSITTCGGSCTAPLLTNPADLYTQVVSGNTPTRFVRTVRLETVPSGGNIATATQVTVTVTVTFKTNGISYSTQVVDRLYNWL